MKKIILTLTLLSSLAQASDNEEWTIVDSPNAFQLEDQATTLSLYSLTLDSSPQAADSERTPTNSPTYVLVDQPKAEADEPQAAASAKENIPTVIPVLELLPDLNYQEQYKAVITLKSKLRILGLNLVECLPNTEQELAAIGDWLRKTPEERQAVKDPLTHKPVIKPLEGITREHFIQTLLSLENGGFQELGFKMVDLFCVTN